MGHLLGIDLGTSSVRSLILDVEGRVLAFAQEKYGVLRPRSGWAEQDMEELWRACRSTLHTLSAWHPDLVRGAMGVGLSGQMHGLVPLDASHRPLRNAIIWEDQRSTAQLEVIEERVGMARFRETTLNRPSTGYMVASLLWMRDEEPELFARARTVLLPKDLIRFMLCGEIGTDRSDASSTLLFDTARGDWSWEIIDRLSLPRELFPACGESHEIAGEVTAEAARETGLREGTPVTFGGGDTMMLGIGTGAIDEAGAWAANIGTGHQVSCASARPLADRDFRTNTFCHARDGLWLVMGSELCGGSAMRWLTRHVFDGISFLELELLAKEAPAGSEGLIFLPFLNGARLPEPDPRAKGMLMGLTLRHDRSHIARSVMEGVLYSVREAYETLEGVLGHGPERVVAASGGARSELLLQMMADILRRPICTTVEPEQSCVGAALTAGVGTGAFGSYEEACGAAVRFEDRIVEPDAARARIYDEAFEIYQELYRRDRDLFWRL